MYNYELSKVISERDYKRSVFLWEGAAPALLALIFMLAFLLPGRIDALPYALLLLIFPLLYGLLRSVIAGHQYRAVANLQYEIDVDSLKTSQKREIIFNLSYEKAFDLCISSTELFKEAKIIQKDSMAGRVKIRIAEKLGRVTWITVFAFKLEEIDERETLIEIASWPKISFIAFDAGYSLKAIETVVSFLTKSDMQPDAAIADN